MSNFSEVLDKANQLVNFQARKLNDALNKIDELVDDIAEHTLLRIMYPNDPSAIKWIRQEVFNWLKRIKSYNNVKTKSGKIPEYELIYKLYGEPLGGNSSLEKYIRQAMSHKNGLPENKQDISNYNLDNFKISLSSIYEDYIDFIYSRMTENELQSRMTNYYLYEE